MKTTNENIKVLPSLVKITDGQEIKLIIPEHVESMIRHLCNRIHNVEWSGILFYDVQGSFESKDLVLTCKDIYVMDIGSSTYTEFNMAPEVMSYMVDRGLLDCQSGLIHSHNNMSTFFSGTDQGTLREEGNDRNHFLSLIVNNEGTYTAAITRKVSVVREYKDCLCYNTFNNEEVKDCEDFKTTEFTQIQYFPVSITKEESSFPFNDIDQRLKEIQDSKKTKEDYTKFATKKDSFYPDSYPNLFSADYKSKVDYDIDKVRPSLPTKGKIDDYLVKSLALQIITASSLITADSNININKYIEGLDKVIQKRFGDGKEGIKRYENFMDFFIETLLFDAVEDDNLIFDLSAAIHEYIYKLPQNKYIDICLSKLETFLVE